jgi:nicotinamidase-related amidase/alkylated DNA repair dioxygenase AlkB/glutathione S-transferase
VVDLQRDFFDPAVFQGKDVGDPWTLYGPIAALLQAFPEHDVYTVVSNYAATVEPGMTGTHVPRRVVCCVAGTPGAEVQDEFAGLLDGRPRLVKTLHSVWPEHGAGALAGYEAVWVCGIMTHVCVQSAALDAPAGVAVTVISDGCAASRPSHHTRALETMRARGVRVASVTELLRVEGGRTARVELWDGSAIQYNAFPPLVEALDEEVNFAAMEQHGGQVPRLVCAQGTIERAEGGEAWAPLYRHPIDHFQPLEDWSPTARRILDTLNEAQPPHEHFNHALIQRYASLECAIGDHADKVLDIVAGTPIVNASFGAERTMTFRAKRRGTITRHIRLPDGSVFFMGAATNRNWLHGIKRTTPHAGYREDPKATGELRISLTFRVIGTWMRSSDGMLRGQGAPTHPLAVPFREQQRRLLWAFGVDNRATEEEFRYEEAYGGGFDIWSTQPKPRLYVVNGSIPSWRVRVWLEGAGVAHEVFRLRIMREHRQTRTDYFLRHINPKGKCPVWVDADGVIMDESLRILTNLAGEAAAQGNASLATLADRLLDAYEPMETLFEQGREDRREVARRAIPVVHGVLAELEAALAGVDVTGLYDGAILYPVLGYLIHRGLRLDPAEQPRLSAFVEHWRGQPWMARASPAGWRPQGGRRNLFREALQGADAGAGGDQVCPPLIPVTRSGRQVRSSAVFTSKVHRTGLIFGAFCVQRPVLGVEEAKEGHGPVRTTGAVASGAPGADDEEVARYAAQLFDSEEEEEERSLRDTEEEDLPCPPN